MRTMKAFRASCVILQSFECGLYNCLFGHDGLDRDAQAAGILLTHGFVCLSTI